MFPAAVEKSTCKLADLEQAAFPSAKSLCRNAIKLACPGIGTKAESRNEHLDDKSSNATQHIYT